MHDNLAHDKQDYCVFAFVVVQQKLLFETDIQSKYICFLFKCACTIITPSRIIPGLYL
ncbi:hypothetical protein SBF1_6830003 [Candidatus Desulfosporosinus infrequens]|uniref:Uncharacterized protein n=1 Tax=Candidatus Desulfosporosinus infrequens TaxID=2043169 RepID=A0A2U3LP13_9FIRM|nr:hypothetical protein SBF1_6830003 [Candidatus Desulfosporosinus infrequens]